MQADTAHHNSQTARHSSPLYMTLLQYIIMYIVDGIFKTSE